VRLDQFDIAERLYGGGKSEVFRGTRRADGVAVVIKVPASSSPSSQEFDRFRREARLAVQVGHPGVVVPLELVDSGGTIALVMPDTGAVPLSARLTQPLSTREFLVMARSLAATLAAVHDAGVVHRDIKPDNIVLSPDGAVQLVDFGLATELQQGLADRQETGSLVGTLPWMSPELTGRLNRPVGYRTDLYSLGATFFAMLTARPPFEDEDEDALALVHAHIAR
jgi:serine/threonine protein kinase